MLVIVADLVRTVVGDARVAESVAYRIEPGHVGLTGLTPVLASSGEGAEFTPTGDCRGTGPSGRRGRMAQLPDVCRGSGSGKLGGLWEDRCALNCIEPL